MYTIMYMLCSAFMANRNKIINLGKTSIQVVSLYVDFQLIN